MDHRDDEQEGKKTLRTGQEKSEGQRTNKPLNRPILLADLLTPSEQELANDITLDPAKSQHDGCVDTKPKIMSRLRTKGHKKGKRFPVSVSMQWHKAEPDCYQGLKTFKLSEKQLAYVSIQ
jgi:hypothetical protein